MDNRLGRYELVARLATGGMGEIFLARLSGEGGFERRVVVKRLLPELVPAGQYVKMFLDEARLAARLTHPNVCEVHELGVDQGQYFIVMPYLEGVPFSRLMRRGEGDARTHLRLVAGALAQACTGLHHAHELTGDDGMPLGVVHRDVSPSNLFVTADGVVKVLDFGIAKARIATSVTEKGMLKGKLAYMSPEQLGDGPIDRRSDVFCLGIVLHEALTGRPLFHREPAIRAAEAVLSGDIPDPCAADPGIPRALGDVVRRALDRDPAARFATAQAMGEALIAAARPLGGAMPPEEIATLIRNRFAAELDERRALITGDLQPLEPPTLPSASTTRPLRPPPKRTGRRFLLPLGAGVAVIASAIIYLAVREQPPTPSLPPLRGERELAAPDAHSSPVPSPPSPSPSPSYPSPSSPSPSPSPPRARPAPGYLSVDSTPGYAIIYLDDRKLGPTPVIGRKVAAGRHVVRAVLPGGRKQSRVIHVDSGRREPVAIHFSW